jgi:hypothetical protein
LNEASKRFWDNGDWTLLQKAVSECREKNAAIAAKIQGLCQRLDRGESPEEIRCWAEKYVLMPLGLVIPDRNKEAT